VPLVLRVFTAFVVQQFRVVENVLVPLSV
jgi:hypothetical protein